jgi:hypothetical protein
MALADVLAELVPKPEEIKLLLLEAQIELGYVRLTGSPQSNWQSALSEAERVGNWPRLIVAVLHRFPLHASLWRALGERAGPGAGSLWEPSPERESETEDESPMDERDRRELEKIRENIHKINGILNLWDKERALYEVRQEGRQANFERDLQELRDEVSLLQRNAATYISARWVWISVIVFFLLLLLGILYLESRPYIPPLPSTPGGF